MEKAPCVKQLKRNVFQAQYRKDPLSRVSLKNISFEPSRRPDIAGPLRYRKSFLAVVRETRF